MALLEVIDFPVAMQAVRRDRSRTTHVDVSRLAGRSKKDLIERVVTLSMGAAAQDDMMRVWTHG
jgi:hypothetical protein